MTQERSGVALRGFASMDASKQREIARKRGANVPHEKRSFAQDRALAAETRKAVPVHHEHEQVIARAVPAPLRRAEDAVDLVLGPPNLDLAELASGKTLMGNLTKG